MGFKCPLIPLQEDELGETHQKPDPKPPPAPCHWVPPPYFAWRVEAHQSWWSLAEAGNDFSMCPNRLEKHCRMWLRNSKSRDLKGAGIPIATPLIPKKRSTSGWCCRTKPKHSPVHYVFPPSDFPDVLIQIIQIIQIIQEQLALHWLWILQIPKSVASEAISLGFPAFPHVDFWLKPSQFQFPPVPSHWQSRGQDSNIIRWWYWEKSIEKSIEFPMYDHWWMIFPLPMVNVSITI